MYIICTITGACTNSHKAEKPLNVLYDLQSELIGNPTLSMQDSYACYKAISVLLY